MSVSRLRFMTKIARFATLFEEKGTFYKKRGPKGDPFGHTALHLKLELTSGVKGS